MPPFIIENSNPGQLDRVGLSRIPLAHVDILILVNAYIMAMLKNRFVLQHNLQDALSVIGFCTTRVRNHPIVFI